MRTSTSKKSPAPPFWGSAAGAGGMSHLLHDLQQATLRAKNHAPDAKSAPLPNAVRHRGAADERQRGPRGARGACHTFCTTHNTPPREPKTTQPTPSLPPILNAVQNGGQKTCRLTHAMAPMPDLDLGGSQWQARFRGAQARFRGALAPFSGGAKREKNELPRQVAKASKYGSLLTRCVKTG